MAGFVIIHAIATDRAGRVYAAARSAKDVHSIVKFDTRGRVVTSWSRLPGSGMFECLAVADDGRVYVTVSRTEQPGVEVYTPATWRD